MEDGVDGLGDLGLWDPTTAGISTTDVPTDEWVPTPDAGAAGTPDYSASTNQLLASDVSNLPPNIQEAYLSGQIDGATAMNLAQLSTSPQATQWTQDVQAAQQEGLQNLQAAGFDPDKIGYDPSSGQFFTQAPDGSWTPIKMDDFAPAPMEANIPGSVLPDGTVAGAQPSQTWGQILNSAFNGLNSLLSSPGGKLLAGLGVGGASLGLAHALAGDVAKVKAPSLPNAATSSAAIGLGQGALVNAYNQGGQESLTDAFKSGLAGEKTLGNLLNLQASQEIGAQQTENPITAGVRTAALGQIPGQMNATTNPNIVGTGQLGQAANTAATSLVPGAGEIGGGIGQQIRNVLSGHYSNPILENNIKMKRQAFEANMYAQLGPGWQTSTPGMQAQEQQDLLEESLRFQDQQQTISNYTPLYNSIIQNQANIGTGATGQIQAAQNQGLNQNVALSQLGRTPATTLASNLNTIAPPTSLAALPAAAATTQQQGSQAFSANAANAASANQANQSLSAGIGALGGAIAGNLTKNAIGAGMAAG